MYIMTTFKNKFNVKYGFDKDESHSLYALSKITNIGHSQGGYQAQLLGANTKEIITLNKATRPQEFQINYNDYYLYEDMKK